MIPFGVGRAGVGIALRGFDRSIHSHKRPFAGASPGSRAWRDSCSRTISLPDFTACLTELSVLFVSLWMLSWVRPACHTLPV